MSISLAASSLGEIIDLARVINTPLGKHWNVVALLYSALCNTSLVTSPVITLEIGEASLGTRLT